MTPAALDRLQEIAAEAWAWELVIALRNAIDGQPHWRAEAQHLLRLIDAAELPEPVTTDLAHVC